jgi:predicted nucleotidyltransferase
MIYTLEQINELVEPIAKKYQLNALWVFGSYARGEATDESDVDFLIDDSDSKVLDWRGFIDMADEIEQLLNKKVDLLPLENLYGTMIRTHFSIFMNTVMQERVIIYEKKMSII